MTEKLEVKFHEGSKIIPFPKKIAKERTIDILSQALSTVDYEALEPITERFNETVLRRIKEHFDKQAEFTSIGADI